MQWLINPRRNRFASQHYKALCNRLKKDGDLVVPRPSPPSPFWIRALWCRFFWICTDRSLLLLVEGWCTTICTIRCTIWTSRRSWRSSRARWLTPGTSASSAPWISSARGLAGRPDLMHSLWAILRFVKKKKACSYCYCYRIRLGFLRGVYHYFGSVVVDCVIDWLDWFSCWVK